MARGPGAVGDQAGGRPHLRPRHRRQQGPAHDQHRPRIAAVLARARPARLQREGADRDRRGDRLARACATSACRTRTLLEADVLIASDGPRLRRERPTIFLGSRGAHEHRLHRRPARGRPPLRQLGRPARQSRHRPRPGARLDHRRRRGAIRVPRMAADAPCRTRCARRCADCVDRGRRGRARRSTPSGASPASRRRSRSSAGAASRCSPSRTGNPDNPVNAIPPRAKRALPAALRGRRRSGGHRAGAAPAPRRARLPDGAGRAGARRASCRRRASIPTIRGCNWAAASIERTTGMKPAILPNLGGSLPNDVLLRHARPADGVGAAFLCVVLAARAERAPARRRSRARRCAS